MDALKLLKEDHDTAKSMFKQLEKAEGAKAAKLFGALKDALSLHEDLEETYFYPELKKEAKTEDLVLEGYQEHHVMDLLLQEISGLQPSDETWAPKVKVLQENTEHHIEEEEGELFPKVLKVWDAARREQVGKLMAEMKKQRTGTARTA